MMAAQGAGKGQRFDQRRKMLFNGIFLSSKKEGSVVLEVQMKPFGFRVHRID